MGSVDDRDINRENAMTETKQTINVPTDIVTNGDKCGRDCTIPNSLTKTGQACRITGKELEFKVTKDDWFHIRCSKCLDATNEADISTKAL